MLKNDVNEIVGCMQLVINLSRTFRRHSCAVNQIVVIPQGIAKIHKEDEIAMWVNISQAAKLTGYKYGEIRRLIAKGAFPFYHNGKKAFKFELEDLKTAMKAEMEATQAAAKKKWEEQQLGARPFDFKGGMARLKAEAKVEKRKIDEEKRHTCRVIKGGDRGNEFDFRSQLKRLQKEASGKNETA